jgi:hypothetical protein
VRRKSSRREHVHGVQLDFRKLWELVSHFSEVVGICYDFPKIKSISAGEVVREVAAVVRVVAEVVGVVTAVVGVVAVVVGVVAAVVAEVVGVVSFLA